MLSYKKKLEIFQYHLTHWGNTRKYYDVYRNDEHVFFTQDRDYAIRNCEEGDVVKVEFCYGRRWTEYTVGNDYFSVEYTDLVESFHIGSANRNYGRDFQRSRCYKMERAHYYDNCPQSISGFKTTKDQAQRLADLVGAVCGMKYFPKVIVSNRLKAKSYADVTKGTINLASGWGLRLRTVVHELAHIVHYAMKGCDMIHHGAQFVSVVVALYESFLIGWEPIDIGALCEAHKVKYCEETYTAIKSVIAGKIEPQAIFQEEELAGSGSFDDRAKCLESIGV